MQQATYHIYPGVVFRLFKRPSVNYGVYHCRAVVDDQYAVLRYYDQRRGWVYGLKDLYYLGLLIESGDLQIIGRDKI
jgi:hypothetical protein